MAYEIRAMSLGEVLDTAFRLVRDHAAILLGISLTVTVPSQLFALLIGNATAQETATLTVGILGLAIFMLIVSPVVGAAITHAIGKVYLGQTASYGASLSAGFKLLMRLMGTSFLMILVLIPAFVLLIIPGLYLAFAYMLVYQVIVIEGSAGWTALKRSYELTKGNMLRVFGVYLVSMVLMVVVSGALHLVSAQIPYASFVIDSLVQAVLTAYLSAALVVLYFDIRCRKEAFDLEHLAGRVGDAQPRTAPTA
jgi:hypothetical protein